MKHNIRLFSIFKVFSHFYSTLPCRSLYTLGLFPQILSHYSPILHLLLAQSVIQRQKKRCLTASLPNVAIHQNWQGEHQPRLPWELWRSCRDWQLNWDNLLTEQLSAVFNKHSKHHSVIDSLGSKHNLLSYWMICGRQKLTLHTTLKTPFSQLNMVLVASCCVEDFLQQGHGRWSELGKWMELNKKTCQGQHGADVHLPAGQWP